MFDEHGNKSNFEGDKAVYLYNLEDNTLQYVKIDTQRLKEGRLFVKTMRGKDTEIVTNNLVLIKTGPEVRCPDIFELENLFNTGMYAIDIKYRARGFLSHVLGNGVITITSSLNITGHEEVRYELRELKEMNHIKLTKIPTEEVYVKIHDYISRPQEIKKELTYFDVNSKVLRDFEEMYTKSDNRGIARVNILTRSKGIVLGYREIDTSKGRILSNKEIKRDEWFTEFDLEGIGDKNFDTKTNIEIVFINNKLKETHKLLIRYKDTSKSNRPKTALTISINKKMNTAFTEEEFRTTLYELFNTGLIPVSPMFWSNMQTLDYSGVQDYETSDEFIRRVKKEIKPAKPVNEIQASEQVNEIDEEEELSLEKERKMLEKHEPENLEVNPLLPNLTYFKVDAATSLRFKSFLYIMQGYYIQDINGFYNTSGKGIQLSEIDLGSKVEYKTAFLYSDEIKNIANRQPRVFFNNSLIIAFVVDKATKEVHLELRLEDRFDDTYELEVKNTPYLIESKPGVLFTEPLVRTTLAEIYDSGIFNIQDDIFYGFNKNTLEYSGIRPQSSFDVDKEVTKYLKESVKQAKRAKRKEQRRKNGWFF